MRLFITVAAVAASLALAGSAASAAGTQKFCLKGPGTALNCTYETMASCDKAKKGTETCVANPSSTTGTGTTSSMKK
jgi:hypothetical protein